MDVQLETPRLILREFRPDDAGFVLAYQSDPRYLRYYPGETRTREDAEAFVDMFLRWQAETPRRRFQLAIVTKRPDGMEDELIGNCGVRVLWPADREGEFGCEIAPSHWGNGYSTEAGRAMLRFAFGELGLHRVRAECIAENEASARMLERLGMRQEGLLRENRWMKGRWWDTRVYGLLEGELLRPGVRSQEPGAGL
jgi:ribosomal-protein-alanine N-acetyltransferase